jgi:hypothetical protein
MTSPVTWRAAVLAAPLAAALAAGFPAAGQTAAPPGAQTAAQPAPQSAAPANLQAFAGYWNGSWENKLPITLVVDQVTAQSARVIYEWGISAADQINNPGFIRATAHFEGERMVVRLPSGSVAIYILQPDDTLAGIAGGTVGGTVLGPSPPKGGVIHATLTRQ